MQLYCFHFSVVVFSKKDCRQKMIMSETNAIPGSANVDCSYMGSDNNPVNGDGDPVSDGNDPVRGDNSPVGADNNDSVNGDNGQGSDGSSVGAQCNGLEMEFLEASWMERVIVPQIDLPRLLYEIQYEVLDILHCSEKVGITINWCR